MPAPSVPGAAGPPPFFPWEAALPIPAPRGYAGSSVPLGTQCFVRKTGSDANGGSSNGTAPDRTGADGVTNGTTQFTSATGNFTQADVGKLINIVTKNRYRIVTVTNSTTIQLSGSPTGASSLTWNLGGATLTVGALLAAPAGTLRGGDTVWIGAGVYRETITVAATPTSELKVCGDITGVHTGDPGIVEVSSFVTNDRTAPVGSTLTLNGKSWLTFQDLILYGGANVAQSCFIASTTSQYITWRRVVFVPSGKTNPSYFGALTLASDTPAHWLFDSCISTQSLSAGFLISAPRPLQGEVDLDVTFFNHRFIGSPVSLTVSAGGTVFKWGGVRFNHCTVMGGGVFVIPANFSTLIPMTVYNSVLIGAGSICFAANTAGQIVEDGNLITGYASARSNTAIGPTSVVDGAPKLEFGQSDLFGLKVRPYLMPSTGSELIGMGGVNASPMPVLDGLGFPRPPGGSLATRTPGALLRSGNFVQQITTTQAGANAISVTGAGAADLNIPVDATPITISIWCRYDTNYVGPLPSVRIVNGQQVGIDNQERTFTKNALGAFEQMTLTITPTAAGVLTIRLIAGDTSGTGVTIFDSLNIA